MATISATHVPHNTGWAGDLKKGQVIRITATTTVDFVFFRLQNLRERFDQDIPSPFNLNQHMKIDGATGRMEHTQVRPQPGNFMDLRAEMDLLVALSACPDLAVGGKPVDVSIYEP